MNKRAQDHPQYQNLQPKSEPAVSDKEGDTTLYDDVRSDDKPEKGLGEGGGEEGGRAGGQDSSFESGDIGHLPQDFRVDAMGLVEEVGKVGGDERIGGKVVSNETVGEEVGEILK